MDYILLALINFENRVKGKWHMSDRAQMPKHPLTKKMPRKTIGPSRNVDPELASYLGEMHRHVCNIIRGLRVNSSSSNLYPLIYMANKCIRTCNWFFLLTDKDGGFCAIKPWMYRTAVLDVLNGGDYECLAHGENEMKGKLLRSYGRVVSKVSKAFSDVPGLSSKLYHLH